MPTNNNTSQLKWGSVLSYGQMGLSVLVTLIYTPLLIKFLGQSEYGLYNTVVSTMSMLSVLSLGFNSGYIKYYTQYKKANDEKSIYRLNGLMLLVFIVIGVVALVCGIFLTFNLRLVFDNGLTETELEIARVLMLILTINLTLSFPAVVFTQIITAHEKFIFLKLVQMLRTVASPLITIPLLYLGYGSIAAVIVTALISFLVDVIFLYFVIIKLHNKFVFTGIEKGLFFNIFKYTSFIAINLIIDQINWSLDKVLLGRFCGTIAVAVYAVASTIHTCFQRFSTSISGVFTPRIHKIIATSENVRNDLTVLFTKVGRIQYLILCLISSGFIIFGKPFVKMWAGDGFEEAYYVALLLILPVIVPLIQNLGIEIQRAENKHKYRSIVYSFIAIANTILTVILSPKYGATGAALGTALSMIAGEGIIMNIYYHQKCNINILAFWKSIVRMSLGLILPICFGVIINKNIHINSLPTFLAWAIVYAIVYCLSMWVLGLNEYEKKLITSPIRRITSSLKK